MQEPFSKKDKMIISLLGRLAFPEDKLKEMITKNKRNPDAYLRGYNSFDGINTVTEISGIIGVNQSTLTPILQDWETRGIIYEVDSNKGKTYRGLYKLSGIKEKSKQVNNTPEVNTVNSVINNQKGEVKEDESRTN